MKKTLKVIGKIILALAACALVVSMLVLIAAQFYADTGNAVITLGDYEIAVAGLFENSILIILAAWLITAFAFVAAGLALAFAFGVVALTFISIAFLFASPFILAGLIVWYFIRKSRNAPPSSPSNPSVGGTTLPPAAA
jgi:hypothetical protein